MAGRLVPTLSKSWVPGVGYKALHATSTAERKAIAGARAAGQRVGPRPGVTEDDKTFQHAHRNLSALHSHLSRNLGSTETAVGSGGARMPTVNTKRGPIHGEWTGTLGGRINPLAAHGHGTEGITVNIGGKKSGGALVRVNDNASPAIHAHEMAHALPNRSAYRMRQISQSEPKKWAEEARADMHAGVDYTKPATTPLSRYAHVAAESAPKPSTPAPKRGLLGVLKKPQMPAAPASVLDHDPQVAAAFGGSGYKLDPDALSSYRRTQDSIRTAQARRSR